MFRITIKLTSNNATCGIDTNILDCKNFNNDNRMYVCKVTWKTVFNELPYIRALCITAKKMSLMLNDENDITVLVLLQKPKHFEGQCFNVLSQ